MIRFLHAADLHLGAPFSSLTAAQAAVLRKEQAALPQAVADAANAHDCDLLLLAGDLFDAADVDAQAVEDLARALAGCRAEVFLAPGNHDPAGAGSVYRCFRWPENVHIFLNGEISSFDLPRLRCRVWGAGFQRAHMGPMLEGFRAKGDGFTELMVLHGDAVNAASDYNPVSREQIASCALHYLALGHIHQASGLLHAGQTAYAWPGCAMGRGFDETGPKGAYLGEVDGSGACRLEFLPLSTRRYEIARVAAGDDPLTSAMAALPQDTQNDIYRILFTGEAGRLDIRALYSALSPRFFALALRDETTPKRALWEGADGDTLRGLFLRTLKKQYDEAADEEEKRRIALAAQYGVAALEGKAVAL